MSTRYVWEKYTPGVKETTTTQRNAVFNADYYDPCAGYTKDLSNYPSVFLVDPSKAYTHVYPSQVHPSGAIIQKSVATYPYVRVGDNAMLSTTVTSGDWIFSGIGVADDEVKIWLSADVDFTCDAATYGGITLLGAVSSNASGAYPQDGEQDSYWYTYKGSDSIDPTELSYSTDAPKGGESVTVTLTPAANTYGGTISYQYQCQVDGGSWTNAGAATTATSKDIVVPKGAETFRVRALASDDMGFTSADYVTGAELEVQNLVADIGVANEAHAVDKLFIGVGGVAHEVVAAFIGVNGEARELF